MLNMRVVADNKMPIFTVIGLLVMIPTLAAVNGFLLMYLWSWFIVPLKVAELSYPHAIGIGTILNLFRTNVREKNFEKVLFENIIFIAVTFLTGYAVHILM